MPSLPAVRMGASGPATRDSGSTWLPRDPAPLAVPKPSVPTVELEALPLPVVGAGGSAPSRPAVDETAWRAVSVSSASPAPTARKQRRGWQRWDVAVGTFVLLLVAYLVLAGVLYASRLWQARQ